MSTVEKLEFRTLSPEEIDDMVRDAQKIRARAVADILNFLGRGLMRGGTWLWSGVEGLFTAIAEAREARRLYDGLSQMSDHQLADIGLTRGDIPAVVAGTFRRPEERPDNIRRLEERPDHKGEDKLEIREPQYKEAA